VAGTPDFGDLHLVNDVSSADWIVAGVRNFEYDVGSLVPLGFDAYARVFHPAGLSDGADSIEVSWAAVAAANGRVAHAAMEWVAITGDWRFMTAGGQAGVWNVPPTMGSLPVSVDQSVTWQADTINPTPQPPQPLVTNPRTLP
jgi:hypothetical protein